MAILNWRFLDKINYLTLTNMAVSVGDSLITALGKLQGQITNILSGLSSVQNSITTIESNLFVVKLAALTNSVSTNSFSSTFMTYILTATVAANQFKVGSTIRIRVFGQFTQENAPNGNNPGLIVNAYLGNSEDVSNNALVTSLFAMGNKYSPMFDNAFEATFGATIDALGNKAAFQGYGKFSYDNSNAGFMPGGNSGGDVMSPTAVSPTLFSSNTVDTTKVTYIHATFATSDATCNATIYYATIELLK